MSVVLADVEFFVELSDGGMDWEMLKRTACQRA